MNLGKGDKLPHCIARGHLKLLIKNLPIVFIPIYNLIVFFILSLLIVEMIIFTHTHLVTYIHS